MQGLSTQKTPSPIVVLPHYIFAAVSFFTIALLLLITSSSLFGHYFQPHLLAITHITVLGWGTMIIFGALYQLLPVVLEVGLFSEKFAVITFYLFAFGTILLVYAFWNFSIGLLLQIAACIIFSAILLFTSNVFLTVRKSTSVSKKIEADFIATSVLWLFLTVLMGILMSFNFTYPFLKESHLLYLKIHAHFGILGWFLLLIIGVSSKLIPMFLLVHETNRKKLSFSYYLINTALLALTIDFFFFHGTVLIPLYVLITISGIMFYISYLYEIYKKRPRKNLDAGLKHSFFAIIVMVLPLATGLLISFNPAWDEPVLFSIYMVYGISVFLGFITALILGQTFKTLPFIVWLSLYKKAAGKTKIPLPKDLYSEKIAVWQFRMYLTALLILIFGVILGNIFIIRAGSAFLLITAILYNINVFKILFRLINAG